jgi:hypothetical protein
MIHLISSPATPRQLKEMLEERSRVESIIRDLLEGL